VPHVRRLSIAPVKGLGLLHPHEILLDRHGVSENRRFHLVEPDGRRYASKEFGPLVRVVAEYDVGAERLSLRFPDGAVADDEVRLGRRLETDFYGRPVPGRVVEGPWAAALSDYVGRPLELVRCDRPGAGVDRGPGPVSLVSDASIAEFARHARIDSAEDGRRFRMLVVAGGCEPHEEDGWLGAELRIGEAIVHILGTVARCVVTTRSPDTGERDVDTLRVLKSYRGQSETTGGFDFGVFGEVVEPGRVRVGDPIEVTA
jgi:uncharacterized protein YcbX